MKKHFNKRKFESSPKREGDRRKEYSDKRARPTERGQSFGREWKKGIQHSDNSEQRGGGYGERRNDRDKEKRFPEKREWKKDNERHNDKENRKTGYANSNTNERSDGKKPWKKSGSWSGNRNKYGGRKPYDKKRDDNIKKAFEKSERNSPKTPNSELRTPSSELIRLNKYLSNAGICSRREADKYISAGVVTVNGKIITELGYKVSPSDKVQFGGNKVHKEKTVYILLNKPKGYITTCDDPHERDTVMDLIKEVQERVYPVGRLDRHTSGLLLLTNDGELAKVLMHPKYQVPKVYHVELDKPLRVDDLDKIRIGIELEDGFIKPDDIAYVDGAATKKEIGIEIHSGRNRIVRRIFESLGYIVMKLDRVFYAGLTKKTLSRGKWRFLADNEVRMLKRNK
ncbi:MAG: RNA-binding S4 domain-containing protein [Bacteroidetes bacterium]|nr:RNA-binding S4 domain-containing protein [Bacteroidota bacterium]